MKDSNESAARIRDASWPSMRRREAPLGEIFGHVEPADVDFLTHLGGHQRLDHRDRIGAVLHLRAELGAKARIPVEDDIDLLLDDGELASTRACGGEQQDGE
jgi:hypothetical protein